VHPYGQRPDIRRQDLAAASQADQAAVALVQRELEPDGLGEAQVSGPRVDQSLDGAWGGGAGTRGDQMTEHAVRFLDLAAAADFLGPGALETPRFESEIVDLVRRRGVLGQRIRNVPATGQPSRYFEQTRIVEGQFQDPRNMSWNVGNDPTRRERAVTLKALYSAINFGIFDVEVTRAQGQFSMLVAKDITDTVQGQLRTSDKALWNGTDTDLVVPTTLQYVGGLT
jgi:hypothetical protein